VIRYSISREELERLIEEEKRGWLARAAERTEKFRAAGSFQESKSIWSEVKPVYMRLQGQSKCVFCERKLEAVELGTAEQDVEHFRPKGNVSPWKVPPELEDELQGQLADVPDDTPGYYLLPYHILNYAASCKPCNSALKGDRFPIAGTYTFDVDDPADLRDEKPYLIYPIGDLDEAPEDLIEFYGISPRAVVARPGYRRNRALVTIAFFALDDIEKRRNLIRERAMVISGLFPQLERAANHHDPAKRRESQEIVDGFTSPAAPHTNCARSLRRLYENSPAEAELLFDDAGKVIAGKS
jgi:hypothetical protein